MNSQNRSIQPKAKGQKKEDIILCLCPSWGVEMPPISLGTLKTALAFQGVELRTRDLNLETYLELKEEDYWDKSNLHYWVNPRLFAEQIFPRVDPLLEKISDELAYGPWKYICFSILSSNVIFTNRLAQRIKLKTPDKTLIVGGPCLCFREERERLRTDFDFFVVGEGEESLVELYHYLEGLREHLPEAVYQTRRVGEDLPFRMTSNLSVYGVPDYSDLNLDAYKLDSLPLILTRSCLFKCRFCADFRSMGVFRKQSSQRIFEMIDTFYQQGYRSFWLNDLLINGIMKELVEVFLRLESEGRIMEWIALATPNRQLILEELKILARNGLKTLNLGIESGSDSVMRKMKKGFNQEQAESGLRRIRQAGVNTQLNIIVGFPGETESEFEETLSFLTRNKEYICGFTSVNSCVLLAGSQIARFPDRFGIQWEDGADMQTEWTVGEENTPAIRKDRLLKVLQWVHENGYDLYSSNRETS
jgi:anaerobic magnesium-protoporphyrin IX monomethyl ester cyclase